AEALPRRCHRSLVSDALTVAGWRVLHILSDGRAEPHTLTPSLTVRDGRMTYPAPLWAGVAPARVPAPGGRAWRQPGCPPMGDSARDIIRDDDAEPVP